MPTRRSVLRGSSLLTLSALAGCVAAPVADGAGSDLPSDNSPDGTDDDTRPRGTGGPGVTLASVDDDPEVALSIDVTVTEAVATDDHPPGLRVTVTNTGDAPAALGEARAAVFAYQSSVDEFLVLLPAGGDYPADPGCWRLTEGVGTTEEYRTVTLEPGERHAADLGLYAAGVEADACLPVGEHRFETTMTRFDDPERLDGGESIDWGFSVLLE
ncbi:hypothetical protein [Halolamina rubra]|uniref:hypothetical protein n=1 Tax=Halolamina rubra TaxID=1380430 RepID=UPI0006789531|nr:hypothetical protein [Halolamina rubra]